MRSKIIRTKLMSALTASMENDQFIKPAAPVEQQPTELPYAKIVDDSEETGVTVEPVEIEDLYQELEEGLLDMSLNIKATESLEIIAKISSRNLSNAAMESLVIDTVGAERGTRLLAATTTGGIQCSADIISLEEIATNAAKTGWENIAKQATSLLAKASNLQQTTNEAGSRIVEQFRALKKPVMSYKSGAKVNIATMAGGDRDLTAVIANTKVAIMEDLSGRMSGQLDRAVNDLTKQSAQAIAQRKGELTSIAANGVKMADSMSGQYKIKDPEFKILGFTRTTLDDQLNLAQGIIGAITNNGRKYNFPRYSANKGGKANPIELKPNTVKDLYAIGVNIGNEIDEQSRIWPQRIEALKAVAELARTAGSNVDADRNTWSAEQTAARNVVKMWNANASARKYYINVYNKIASEILQVLNHVTNTSGEASQEAFGGFFGKKPTETPKSPIPVYVPDLIKFIKSTDFPGFQDNFTADITAYNDNLKDHIAGLGKAANEIGRSFNESNINKYVDDVGRLLDRCYAQFQLENPTEDDWRAIGNGVLDIFGPEFTRSKLLSKHFDMNYNNGVYTTKFDYAPNYEISKLVETRAIDNKRLSKRLVTGWSRDMALQYFSLWESTNEVSLPHGLDRCTFIREHPRYEDSVSMLTLEPLTNVTQRLFEIMEETQVAITDGIIRK